MDTEREGGGDGNRERGRWRERLNFLFFWVEFPPKWKEMRSCTKLQYKHAK
jgi:hypothetical protein